MCVSGMYGSTSWYIPKALVAYLKASYAGPTYGTLELGLIGYALGETFLCPGVTINLCPRCPQGVVVLRRSHPLEFVNSCLQEVYLTSTISVHCLVADGVIQTVSFQVYC